MSSFHPGKAVSCTKNIASYPPLHGKAKFTCTKTYFFPPGKAKFHVPKLVLPMGGNLVGTGGTVPPKV